MKKTTFLSIITALASLQAVSAATFFGVSSGNQLVSFDSANPGSFLTSVPINNLLSSDGVTPDPFAAVINLSYNPTTGQFLGIDSNANVYQIGINGNTTLLNNTFSPTGFDAGLAYDPFTAGFAYADDSAERFNLTSAGAASLVGSAFYSAGDANEASTPQITGLAIDPDFGTAYFLDASLGILALAINPDATELFTIGSLGFSVTGYGDLGIDFEGNLYASLSTDGLGSDFYSINVNTGEATMIGSFTSGVSTIAIPEPSAALLGGLGLFALLRRRRA